MQESVQTQAPRGIEGHLPDFTKLTKCLAVTGSTHIDPPHEVGQHNWEDGQVWLRGPHAASHISTDKVGGQDPDLPCTTLQRKTKQKTCNSRRIIIWSKKIHNQKSTVNESSILKRIYLYTLQITQTWTKTGFFVNN